VKREVKINVERFYFLSACRLYQVSSLLQKGADILFCKHLESKTARDIFKKYETLYQRIRHNVGKIFRNLF
jgi:hypothetical protein